MLKVASVVFVVAVLDGFEGERDGCDAMRWQCSDERRDPVARFKVKRCGLRQEPHRMRQRRESSEGVEEERFYFPPYKSIAFGLT